MEPRALDGGARSFLFLLCTYMFYNLPVSRFGYRQTEIKHNKFKTNKLTTAASQDRSQKPQQKSACPPTCPFRVYRANGNEAHQIQNKQVDNSSLDQTKPKTTNLQKRVSCGMVLMASTMLHEKCCNTVLQIGAPVNLKVVPNGCCLGRSPWTN